MIQSRATGPQSAWIAKAERLHQAGHFVTYNQKQRQEVLKKGYIGKWRPDNALAIAREQVELGICVNKSKFTDNMRTHFRLVGDDMREALRDVLAEIPPESYEPPKCLEEPPGYPFIFPCKRLGCRVYLKFQIKGSQVKPRVMFWSCHPPEY